MYIIILIIILTYSINLNFGSFVFKRLFGDKVEKKREGKYKNLKNIFNNFKRVLK